MTRKPPSVEAALRQEWSTKEDIVGYGINRFGGPVTHLIKGNLTTDGNQYSTWAQVPASSYSSKTSYYISGSTYSIDWPGLDGLYAKEIEAELGIALMSTEAATTVGFRWEIKDDDETTWTPMQSTFIKLKAGTSTAVQRTVSGYAPLSTGYNKLPLEVRLRFYSRATASLAKFRVKNTSYVKINRISKVA